MSVSNSLAATPNSRQRRGDGINWAWRNGADVISNSWGSDVPYQIIDDAIDSALIRGRNGLGCVVVFAAGNENSDVNYPANSNPDIIAVGAMSPCGERKRSSSNSLEVGLGVTPDTNGVSCDGEKTWGSNYGNEIDVVAPGVLIPTTDRQGNNGYNPNIPIHTQNGGNKISNDYNDDDYTVWFNGTSSACPQVAGVAALILSINPNLTQDQVRDIIESTCTKVGSYNYSTITGRNNGKWNNQTGYGLLNAYKALKAVCPLSGPATVCSSGSSYSIQNLPTGATITWVPSSNITRISSQGSNPCTFEANEYGNGWIEATINNGCTTITLPRINVSTDMLGISPLHDPNCGYCQVSYGNVGTTYMIAAQTDNPSTYMYDYYWEVSLPEGSGWDEGYADYGKQIYYSPPVAGTYTFKLKQYWGCGWTDFAEQEFEFYGGYGLIFTPNPASGETSITIVSESEEKTFDSDAPWDFEIYSETQQLKTKQTGLRGKSTKIQTAGWKEGVYLVRVKYNNEILTGKLVIKK